MRKTMYTFISGLLRGIEGAPVRHIDLWNSQLAFIEEEAPFARPAVFVEFMPIAWSYVGGYIYEADASVRLHVVSDVRAGRWDEAVSAFDLLDSLTAALSLAHSTDDGIGAMVHTMSETDSLFGELMHNVETYSCHVIYEAKTNKK
jgi:hypothetical protein